MKNAVVAPNTRTAPWQTQESTLHALSHSPTCRTRPPGCRPCEAGRSRRCWRPPRSRPGSAPPTAPPPAAGTHRVAAREPGGGGAGARCAESGWRGAGAPTHKTSPAQRACLPSSRGSATPAHAPSAEAPDTCTFKFAHSNEAPPCAARQGAPPAPAPPPCGIHTATNIKQGERQWSKVYGQSGAAAGLSLGACPQALHCANLHQGPAASPHPQVETCAIPPKPAVQLPPSKPAPRSGFGSCAGWT